MFADIQKKYRAIKLMWIDRLSDYLMRNVWFHDEISHFKFESFWDLLWNSRDDRVYQGFKMT